MCGIAGLVVPAGESTDEIVHVDPVRRTIRRMDARGPDAEGLWTGHGVVLGHKRLAIIDLDPRSNQPMTFSNERYVLVFNGEIYNYRELKRELEAQGERFRTTSDSEVILALYERMGEKMLPRLRGMFAFAIWDTQSRELFLARDSYGIKPLYYAETPYGLLFASQVKALLASGLISAEIEPAGLAGFYLWGSVPEPWTTFRNVRSLPAGSWMRVRSNLPTLPVTWDDIGTAWSHAQVTLSERELQERVRNAITDSVRAHLVADVPVSVFLSGGIDSGAIAGILSELGANLEGVTIAFNEFADRELDEGPVAAEIAKHYRLKHHIRYVTRSEFDRDIPLFMEAMDQPTIDGVNTWFASKAAAERGYKVVLSGVGGDELFYGYGLTREIPRRLNLARGIAQFPGGRALARKAIDAVALGRIHPKVRGLPDFMGSVEGEYFLKRGLFMPFELPWVMGPDAAEEGLGRLGVVPPTMNGNRAPNVSGQICMLDSTLYMRNMLLRDSDWTSMAHSLELRTPLVDAALLRDLSSLHTMFRDGRGKRLLAGVPSNPLPPSIARRRKTGFTVPMTEWLASAVDSMDLRLRPIPGTENPWTRRWARIVMHCFLKSVMPGSFGTRQEDVAIVL
ncbi:asparagine synthase (glutamine-hydrolyzing) [Occallatibacter savannae]|uniref:asparagine synthase (glutamine-hydrolyzing) n=1 Tax=Occallatibacter savannae TaxID=1002691 RepID=UPI000D69C8B8|nr:asparagine synthase (glutamine-hydrolyzing) [Occallatibacter savannae]